jgi:hypothetical protein
MTIADIEKELSYISRTAGRIEGAGEDDYAAADAIQNAVDSIRTMLLEIQPASEEIPAGVSEPEEWPADAITVRG